MDTRVVSILHIGGLIFGATCAYYFVARRPMLPEQGSAVGQMVQSGAADLTPNSAESSIREMWSAGTGDGSALQDRRLPDPVELPRMGTLDGLVLVTDNARVLLMVRNRTKEALISAIRTRCSQFHRNGDVLFETDAAVEIRDGEVTITQVSATHVLEGAPLDVAADQCIKNVANPRLTIAAPKPPPDAPAYVKERYTGRWRGVSDFRGNVLVTIRFGDKCANVEDPSPRPRSDGG